MKNEIIKRRYHERQSERRPLDGILQQIERFVVPYRGNFFNDSSSEDETQWRQSQLYDSTAIQACDTLASSLQGALTSPSAMWFTLQFQNEDLNNTNDAMIWLEECNREVFEELQQANFNIEASEFYLDLCAYGTAIMTEEVVNEDSWDGIDFQSIPMKQCYFEPDHKGGVMNFYRTLNWTPLQILDKFGDETPQDIREAAESTSASERESIIFCIYRRQGVDLPKDGKPLVPKKRPYGFKYIRENDASQLGAEGGYYEQPAFIAKWRKVSGSMWGHSPAMVCLPDVLNINELIEATLEAAGKVIDPASITTQRGLLSDLDLGRGGLTVVRNIGDLVPYETKSRFDVGEMVAENFRQSIRQTFRVDQLQLKESPAMTATEVQVRYEMMQRLLGPTLGRLQNDFLNPLVQRTFNILMRAGRLPEVPQIVAQSAGGMKVEYTGPLPRAQKMDTVRSMQEWLGVVAEASQMFPDMADVVNTDNFSRMSAKLMSIPALIVNDTEKIQEMRDARQEKQAQQEELMQAQAEGEAMQAQGKGAQDMAAAEQGPI